MSTPMRARVEHLLEEWSRVYGPVTPLLPREAGRRLCTPPASPASLLPGPADVDACRRCKLGHSRRHALAGAGAPRPPILFLTEAPTPEADRTGRVYAGDAGTLLLRMIEKGLRLTPDQVYTTSLVKCRPPGDREARPEEIDACFPWLVRQIEAIRPRVIVALGRAPAAALLQSSVPLRVLRKKTHTFRDIPVIATHPLRHLVDHPPAKGETWQDLQRAMQEAGLSISAPDA